MEGKLAVAWNTVKVLAIVLAFVSFIILMVHLYKHGMKETFGRLPFGMWELGAPDPSSPKFWGESGLLRGDGQPLRYTRRGRGRFNDDTYNGQFETSRTFFKNGLGVFEKEVDKRRDESFLYNPNLSVDETIGAVIVAKPIPLPPKSEPTPQMENAGKATAVVQTASGERKEIDLDARFGLPKPDKYFVAQTPEEYKNNAVKRIADEEMRKKAIEELGDALQKKLAHRLELLSKLDEKDESPSNMAKVNSLKESIAKVRTALMNLSTSYGQAEEIIAQLDSGLKEAGFEPIKVTVTGPKSVKIEKVVVPVPAAPVPQGEKPEKMNPMAEILMEEGVSGYDNPPDW